MKKCKFFKKLWAVTVSALMLAFLPNACALTASAAEPVTYYLMYSEGDEDWRYQVGSQWDDDAQSTPSYYLHENIKNGDIVIIGNGSSSSLDLNVRLSNLTICNTTGVLAMVSASGGIDNCFFTNDSMASVTGNVGNAYVHGGSTANFNSNVKNLYSYKTSPDAGPTIGVAGTVAYFMAEDDYDNNPPYGTNFAAGSFLMENGDFKTDYAHYTRDVSDGPAASDAQNTAPASPQPSQSAQQQPPASSGSSDNEYDKVPKTGEASPVVWLSAAVAVCIGLGLIMRKTSRQ